LNDAATKPKRTAVWKSIAADLRHDMHVNIVTFEPGAVIPFLETHVMEHAERLCDRIILMSGGRKVFDGTTQAALDTAPRRMVLASESTGLTELVSPFVKHIEPRKDGALMLTLKEGADAQSVLEKCVAQKIKLSRFEPRPPTLHEAFVALVGDDVRADMQLSPEAAS